jgi:2-amino-4-hydroxy-6-hydroxymethyldihydropteridine diphosphokinase
MARVYVSIGSNIDRERNIRSAIAVLRNRYGDLQISSVVETGAVGFDGEDFYNLVVGFDTDEDIMSIARWLDEIENQHGRDRSGPRFSSRTLDLDLLLYDDLVIKNEEIELPRDEILRYAFVLGPLAELAPYVIHPELHKSIGEIWQDFDQAGQPLRPVSMAL